MSGVAGICTPGLNRCGAEDPAGRDWHSVVRQGPRGERCATGQMRQVRPHRRPGGAALNRRGKARSWLPSNTSCRALFDIGRGLAVKAQVAAASIFRTHPPRPRVDRETHARVLQPAELGALTAEPAFPAGRRSARSWCDPRGQIFFPDEARQPEAVESHRLQRSTPARTGRFTGTGRTLFADAQRQLRRFRVVVLDLPPVLMPRDQHAQRVFRTTRTTSAERRNLPAPDRSGRGRYTAIPPPIANRARRSASAIAAGCPFGVGLASASSQPPRAALAITMTYTSRADAERKQQRGRRSAALGPPMLKSCVIS